MTLYDFGTGGFDLLFTIDESIMATDDGIIVCSTVALTADDAADPDTAKSYVGIYKRGPADFEFIIMDKAGDALEKITKEFSDLGCVRVIAHGKFITIYVERQWIHTFAVPEVYYPLEKYVALKTASASLVVTDIRLKELSDWRDAIPSLTTPCSFASSPCAFMFDLNPRR